MFRKTALAFVFLIVLSAKAQTSDPRQAPQPAVAAPISTSSSIGGITNPGGTELPYSEPLAPPAIANGVQAPMAVGAESTRSNFVSGSFRFVGGFDDNPLFTSNKSASNFSYLFAPGIMFARTRERWSWTLAYNPGFTINQRLNDRNQSSHDLSTYLTFRLSPHVTLRFLDTFEKTSSLFSGVLASPLVPESGPVQGPNQSLITPLAQRTGNVSSVDLGYQFSASSMIGAGGTYYLTNYDQVAGPAGALTGLIDNRSIAADGYYAHRFSNKQWFGTRYDFQRMTFDIGGRTTVYRMAMFYVVPLGTSVSVSLWAGPERSSTDVPATSDLLLARSDSRWSGAGGASFDWTGQHTGFRAGYVRRTSDGGGLSAAVALQQVDVGLRRQLSARWSTDLGVLYANDNPIQTFVNSVGKIRVLSLTAGFSRLVTNDLSFGVQYGRDRQRSTDAPSSLSLVQRNRVLLSLSYSFSRPLGR
jgi:hypothetical protein